MVHSEYTVSLFATAQLLQRDGYKANFGIFDGTGPIDVARNKLARAFLDSKADELLMIDSDLSWHPPDIMRLIARDKPVVGGAGPFRDGTGAFPARLIPDTSLATVCGYFLRKLPTMMMKIQRTVFTQLIDAGLAPIKREWAWDNKGEDDSKEQYHQFFAFREEADRIISEDFTFCDKWKSIGGQLWFEADMTICHYGKCAFKGNFSELP